MSSGVNHETAGTGYLYDGQRRIGAVEYSLYHRVSALGLDEGEFMDGELVLSDERARDAARDIVTMQRDYRLELADGRFYEVTLASVPGDDRIYIVVDCRMTAEEGSTR